MGIVTGRFPRRRRGATAEGSAGETGASGDDPQARRLRRRQTAALCGVLCAGLLGAGGTFVAMRGHDGSGGQDADLRRTRPTTAATATVTPSAPPSTAAAKKTDRVIGDGSTADTGPQPHQPVPQRLQPGQTPPAVRGLLLGRRRRGQQRPLLPLPQARPGQRRAMTFFLSGIYLLPEDKRTLYKPPQHAPGGSDIGSSTTSTSGDTASSCGWPGWRATRSGPTSTATSAPGKAASAVVARRLEAARSPRPRRS